MKTIRPQFAIILFLFSGLFIIACKKDKKNDEEVVTKESFQAQIDGRNWAGKGSYMIAFGNNPQLFILSAENDTSSFHLEFRATGIGTYTSIENGYYVSIPRQTIYKVISGSIVLTEVTQNEIAKGGFSFQAKDVASGKTVTVAEGQFVGVKGSGHW